MASTEQELNRAKELLEKQEAINSAKQKQRELDADILGLSSSLVDSIKEIQGISTKRSTFDQNLLKVNKKIANEISGQRSGLSDISSIQKQISKNQDLIEKSKRVENALESGIFGQERKRLELANDRATSIAEQRTIQEELLANAEKSGKLDKAAYNLSVQKLTNDEASLTAITSKLAPMSKQALFTKQNNVELERQNELRKKERDTIIANEKKLGAFGGILKGISKIPILGDLVDTNKILGTAMDKIKDGGSGVAGLGAGLKEAGNQMLSGLTNPANMALLAFTAIGAALLKNNKKITEFERSMVMSSSEAKSLAGEFSSVAMASDDLNVNTANLVHTFTALSEQFGFIAKFSMETLETATKLEKTVGLSATAAGSLAASAEITDGSFDEQYKNALATSYELQRQSGVQFNLKNILEESSKVTGTTRANLGGSLEEIAKAVTQAKLFGSSLEDVAAAGKSLLDFESSLTKELEAELLIGRDINLEKARSAALAGDQVTLAKELQKEAGTLSEFQNMNVIQQEALAAAMGMTSDQMADILFQQEIQGKTAKELRALGKDELANRLEQQDAQQSFNAAVEQLKGLLADTVKFLDPLLQGFSTVVGFLVQFKELFMAITGIQLLYNGYLAISASLKKKDLALGKKGLLQSVAGMALEGAKQAAKVPVVGALLATAALAGLYMAGKAIIGDDVMSPGENTPGYGKRTLFGPEGAISLNNKDTVIAGTNLFKGDDVVSSPAGSIQMPDNSEAKRTNALLEALIKKPAPKVQMDSIEVGTVAGMSAFSIQ
jgi:hypothetical protein